MTWVRNQSMPRLLRDVHPGRIDAGIDRPAHQDHRGRCVRIVVRFHHRNSGEHRHRGLTDGNHMGVAAEHVQDRNHIVDIVIEIELALRRRHHARVRPIGDVDVMIGQKRLDGAAQQRGEMARHRRDDQKFRLRPLRRMCKRALEMQEPAERPFPDRGDVDRHALAADQRRGDAPFRFAVTACRAFEQFAGRGDGFAVSRE